jgi:hypothetical protein
MFFGIFQSSEKHIFLAHHAEIIPILPKFDRPVGTFDTHQIPYVIEQGSLAAEENLPYLRRLLGSGG